MNQRPSAYEADELPDCSIPQYLKTTKVLISHLLNTFGVSSRNPLQDFQDALLAEKIASKFIKAIEFPSEKAFREYMKDHPKADPDNHSVVLDFKPPAPPKPKLPPHPPTPPKPPRPPQPPKPHKVPKLNPPQKRYKNPRFYQPPKFYQPPRFYQPPSWLGKLPKDK